MRLAFVLALMCMACVLQVSECAIKNKERLLEVLELLRGDIPSINEERRLSISSYYHGYPGYPDTSSFYLGSFIHKGSSKRSQLESLLRRIVSSYSTGLMSSYSTELMSSYSTGLVSSYSTGLVSSYSTGLVSSYSDIPGPSSYYSSAVEMSAAPTKRTAMMDAMIKAMLEASQRVVSVKAKKKAAAKKAAAVKKAAAAAKKAKIARIFRR